MTRARSSERGSGPADLFRRSSPRSGRGDERRLVGDHPGDIIDELVILDVEGNIADRCRVAFPMQAYWSAFAGGSVARAGRLFLRAKSWGTQNEVWDPGRLHIFAIDAPGYAPASGWTVGGNFGRSFRPR